MQLVTMTLPKQTSLFTEDQSTSSQEGSRANHTVKQEKDSERMMNATYGPKCLEQFGRFNRHGLWAKTFAGLLIGMTGWYSTRSKLTWKLKGTKFNRMYFQLFPSTLPTEGIESGLLRTPTAAEATNQSCSSQIYVQDQVGITKKLLPTPTASDVVGGVSNPRQIIDKGARWVRKSDNTGTEFGAKLRDVAGLLPTPREAASRGKRSSSSSRSSNIQIDQTV